MFKAIHTAVYISRGKHETDVNKGNTNINSHIHINIPG